MNAAVSRTRLLQLGLAAAGALLVSPAGGARTAARALARAALGPQSRPAVLRRPAALREREPRRRAAATPPRSRSRSTVPRRSGSRRSAPRCGSAPRSGRRSSSSTWATTGSGGGPSKETPVGSYVMRLTVEDESGNRKTYGGSRPATASRSRTPVVRILGVEAAFDKRSYAPLEPAQLTITRRRGAHHAPVPRLRHGDGVHGPHRRDARRADRAAHLLRLVEKAVVAADDRGQRRRIGSAASTPPS